MYCIPILFLVALTVFIRLRCAPVRVKGKSMLPTLRDGCILISRFDRHPNRFDIIITRYPNRRGFFVKRVVGLPGETVSYRYGVVFINGEPLAEPFEHTHSIRPVPEVLLGTDEYFVLGDNRAISRDSRDKKIGPIPRANLCGRVIGIYRK